MANKGQINQYIDKKEDESFELLKPDQIVELEEDDSMGVVAGKYIVKRIYFKDDEVMYDMKGKVKNILSLAMNYVHGVGGYWKNGILKNN